MMKMRILPFIALLLAAFALSGFWNFGSSPAVYGYDPVAYFTLRKAVEGSKDFSVKYNGEEYRFSSEKHKELFLENPEKYLPEYEGYCAYGVALNNKIKSDPEAWSIVNGRLYLNVNKKVRSIWMKDKHRYIHDANKNWPNLQDN